MQNARKQLADDFKNERGELYTNRFSYSGHLNGDGCTQPRFNKDGTVNFQIGFGLKSETGDPVIKKITERLHLGHGQDTRVRTTGNRNTGIRKTEIRHHSRAVFSCPYHNFFGEWTYQVCLLSDFFIKKTLNCSLIW